ncbi:hypothetical protein TREES_T100019188 [Tupaia chinensis]|uniref:Uncharacterized protein n=1 Tax=Tupaia chinensis TaxID=246437 RepID=L9LCC6_TUPCH|nr:hypothetical protein TREES_T100019188 [Tupaia chinensis]
MGCGGRERLQLHIASMARAPVVSHSFWVSGKMASGKVVPEQWVRVYVMNRCCERGHIKTTLLVLNLNTEEQKSVPQGKQSVNLQSIRNYLPSIFVLGTGGRPLCHVLTPIHVSTRKEKATLAKEPPRIFNDLYKAPRGSGGISAYVSHNREYCPFAMLRVGPLSPRHTPVLCTLEAKLVMIYPQLIVI